MFFTSMFERAAALLLMTGAFTAVLAQDVPRDLSPEVTVSNVRTGLRRAAGGDPWYVVEITVRTKATGSGRSRFADRVGVKLSVATESRDRPAGLEFYQAQSTAVALEAGESVFRFYLPPEIVRRDRLQGNLRFWSVDLSVAGKELPLNRDQVGPGFSSAEALENFRRQVDQQAKWNAGILLPQHLTPWAGTSGTDSAPTMIRVD